MARVFKEDEPDTVPLDFMTKRAGLDAHNGQAGFIGPLVRVKGEPSKGFLDFTPFLAGLDARRLYLDITITLARVFKSKPDTEKLGFRFEEARLNARKGFPGFISTLARV